MAVCREYRVEIPKSQVVIERRGNQPALVKYVLAAPYNREKGYTQPKRTTIGHQCPDDPAMMYPTTQYKNIFPDEWERITQKKMDPARRRMGLYLLLQAVNQRMRIRNLLGDAFGEDFAGVLLDEALYFLLRTADSAADAREQMREELGCREEFTDAAAFARLAARQMGEERVLRFCGDWARQCCAAGVTEVWLFCAAAGDQAMGSGGAEESADQRRVVFAISEQGLPVDFDAGRGPLEESGVLLRVRDRLQACGIRTAGVLLDRGCRKESTLAYLRKEGVSYVALTRGDELECREMIAEYGARIRQGMEYLVPGTSLFAVQRRGGVSADEGREEWFTLFYDRLRGGDQVTALLEEAYREMHRAEAALCAGETPGIPERFREAIVISGAAKDGTAGVEFNARALQAQVDAAGFSGVLSTDPLLPAQLQGICAARTAAETLLQTALSEMDAAGGSVENPEGQAMLLSAFLAAVLYAEVTRSAREQEVDPHEVLSALDRMEMMRINDAYVRRQEEEPQVRELLDALGVEQETLADAVVREANDRLTGRVPVLRHRKPGPKKGSHHRRYDEEGNEIPRKRGIKPGTKRPDVNRDGTPRRKPGVKPGTKRGELKKDGTPRKKPGPKKGSHHSQSAEEP